MTGRTSLLTRLAAGAGVLALAVVGLASTGTAHADVVPNVDPDKTGTLTITKYVEDQEPLGGELLEGVEFTVCEVLSGGAPIDLTVNSGWTLVGSLDAAQLAADPPVLPAGITIGACASDTTGANGEVAFPDLGVGAYLVTETDPGDNLIQTPALPFIVAIPMPVTGDDDSVAFEYAVDAQPKNVLTDFTVEKKAEELDPGHEWVVDQEVDWTISVDIPLSGFNYASVVITDTLPASLGFVSWGGITLGTDPLVSTTDYTIDATTHAVTLTPDGLAKVGKGGQTLTATLTTKVLAIGSLENKATITLNGKPKDDTSKSNWAKVNLKKISSVGDKPLAGAEFELYRQTPGATTCDTTTAANLIGTKTTVADGTASWSFFVGVDTNTTMTVCLKETKAPAGHVLPANPVFGPQTVDAASPASFDWAQNIVNTKPSGPQLPDTGAEGARAMVIGGFGLVLVAGLALAVGRRATAGR